MSPVDVPYAGPTRTTQIIGRGLSIASYSLAFLVSIGDLFTPTATLQLLAPRGLVVTTAIGLAILSLAILSLVGLGAVISRRWRIEWVASATISFLLLERSVPVWGRVFSGEFAYSSVAFMVTLASISLGQRALSLWIFSIKTRQSARDLG